MKKEKIHFFRSRPALLVITVGKKIKKLQSVPHFAQEVSFWCCHSQHGHTGRPGWYCSPNVI